MQRILKESIVNATDFSAIQKEEILKHGDYQCAVCGMGEKEGVKLHIDHIRPINQGGKSNIENGQVLCDKHYLEKKATGQISTEKKLFVNLYEQAKAAGDEELMAFCSSVLEVFEKFNMNGHIVWKK